MSKIVDNVINIPTSLDTNFFRIWLEFLKPFHNLTERETEVMSSFLKHRYILSKDIVSNEDLLDVVVMSDDTRKKVREECKMTNAHFQVVMGTLRRNKLIVDGKLNRRFIPNVKPDAKDFKLMLYFDLNGEKK